LKQLNLPHESRFGEQKRQTKQNASLLSILCSAGKGGLRGFPSAFSRFDNAAFP